MRLRHFLFRQVKFASYNVNGVNARLPRLLEWLAEAKPDVVGLQEIKAEADKFPLLELRAAGYHVEMHGQKGFNGVAILSREPVQEVTAGLPGDPEDLHARWIEAIAGDVHFVCLYLPNGNPAPGPKFDYKLAWMDRLAARAAELLASERPVILAGDFNICPTDFDAARPDLLAGDALVLPESRGRFRKLVGQGWTDAIRSQRPHDPCYTYWDYQGGAWAKNWGFRIDHLLLSPAAADRMVECGIDRHVRAAERASDHVPVWIEMT